LILSQKKYFKRSELEFLQEMFDRDQKPTKDEILQIAARVDCSELQIRNWFSNKRKKMRSLCSKDLSNSNSESPLEKVLEIPALQIEDEENSDFSWQAGKAGFMKNNNIYNDQIQSLQHQKISGENQYQKQIEHLLRYQILKSQNAISQCYNSPFNCLPKADNFKQPYLNLETNLQLLHAQNLFGQSRFLSHPSLIHSTTSTQVQNLERLRNENLQMSILTSANLNQNLQNLIYLNKFK